MPELPEVETIRRDLLKKITHTKIKKVEVNLKKSVKNDWQDFVKILEGNRFKDVGRKGKLLIFELEKSDKSLLIHLKMTGQLIYCRQGEIIAGGHNEPEIVGCLPNKYSHVVFNFTDGSNLFFNDIRRFGYLKLVNPLEKQQALSKFGLEPLEAGFTADFLKDIFAKRKTNIKAVLLNQKLIAGIGNIYADEILFQAGVLPWRQANSLKENEIKKIHEASREILEKAIKHRGTTFSNYVDTEGKKGKFVALLKVYGRDGEKCLKCKKTIISKKKVAGRGTRFCATCQR